MKIVITVPDCDIEGWIVGCFSVIISNEWANEDFFSAIFDRLRSILHESKDLDKRVQYMIEVIFHVRKDKFAVRQ